MRVPSPPALFLGREAELSRLRSMLDRVRSALVFGVAGVGKSTLAYTLAAVWPHPVVYHRVDDDEPGSVVVDRALHQLTRDDVPASMPLSERVAELAERMDAVSALLLVDDVHRLGPGGQELFFTQLAGQLRTGRLVATSRELHPLSPGAPDRLELRLDGLDERGARLLWSSLDELYGPSTGFELAWARSRGNPFLLRRGHAGDLSEEDPITRSVALLSEPERRLAGALALASVPLPTAMLLRLLPPQHGRPVLQRLVTRMVVTVDGVSGCSLHDLFREAVTAALGDAERRELHEALAALLPDAGMDPVVRVTERCRHLRALGRHEEAGKVLVENAAGLVRDGATAELLRALEAILPGHRTPEVRILRARTLARLLEVRRAFEELRALVEEGASPRYELKIAFGHLAMLTARLDVALETLQEVLIYAEPGDVPPALRLRAGLNMALTGTYLGGGELVRAQMAHVRGMHPGFERGFLSFCTAFTLWLDGRSEEAEEPMRTALAIFQEAPTTFRGAVLAPAFAMVLLATLGQLDEAGQMQAIAEAAVKRGEDVRMRMYLRASKAVLLYERGERLRALAELRAVLDALARGGEVLWALWTRAWLGAWLVELGRVREGLEALADVEQDMRGVGLEAGLRFIERARKADLVGQLQVGSLPVPGRATSARARALALLEAGRRGEALRLKALLEEAPPPATPDFALERALGHLARAVAARLEGRTAEAARELEEARRIASEGRVDPELVPSLFELLAPARIVTAAERRAVQASPEELSRYEAVLDARNHVLRLGGREVSLRKRPVLRRLLYALASRPGTVLTKEQLAVAVWSTDYDPLRHDNSLRVNVRYLRELLAGTPLSVEFDDTGYRLLVPEGFAYIDTPGKGV